jgi:hypothetical protein
MEDRLWERYRTVLVVDDTWTSGDGAEKALDGVETPPGLY